MQASWFCHTTLRSYIPTFTIGLCGSFGGAAGLLLTISWLALKLRRQAPYLPVGWFWYLGTLVPVIGLVQVGEQAMADRYTYIPSIGFFIVICWAAPQLLGGWPAPPRSFYDRGPN